MSDAAHPRRPEGGDTDPLTGLANRLAFMERLKSAIDSGGSGSLAYVDIDRFKMINDLLGHFSGDVILQIISQRIVRNLPASSTVARFGGDEFGLLLPDLEPAQAHDLLEECLAAIREPIAGDLFGRTNEKVIVTVSMGIARAGDLDAERSLAESDMAVYAAKRQGGNRVVAYGPEVPGFIEHTRRVAANIERLSRENSELHIQARTDALTGLRNLRALIELEEKRIGSGEASWVTAAVVFIDVDFFGQYNHRYGDPAGDVALRSVAQALVRGARRSDVVFRKGGEEFVVVLPEVDLTSAVNAAERIRTAVEGLCIPHADSKVSGVLTVTLGVSLGAMGDTLSGVRVRASDLVMAAKRNGERNRVHS